MTLSELLHGAIKALEGEGVRYALAGGVATLAYRKNPRTTDDIDFLILAKARTEEVAKRIVISLGLTPGIARKADLEGGPMFAIKRGNTEPYIIVGRDPKDRKVIGVDFILPAFPWFEDALSRAELNRIPFGHDVVPCLTIEDVIVSKLYALRNNKRRFSDMDDLQSIFQSDHEIDLPYLCAQMNTFQIPIPEPLTEVVPDVIRKISKSIRRQKRR
ncbi:MAG TPA: nucleotidyl transferase AbiEii/AbiGii toxin family protein [Bdellovibrionota bacterium]|nr:nucleotidyl transferase AbiEii/AbiGii toxin family protein [Bdellovibrionota bacterium]